MNLEAIMDWLDDSRRKKLIAYSCLSILTALILWGAFIVPSTIMLDSAEAKRLVAITAVILPWVDNLHGLFGFRVEKYIYLQCIYIWIIPIPLLLAILSDFTFRIGSQGINIDIFNRVIFKMILLPLLIISLNIMMNYVRSPLGPSKHDRVYLLNEYFSAIGAIVSANVFVISLLILILGLFYLIVIFRNFDLIIKEHIENLNRRR